MKYKLFVISYLPILRNFLFYIYLLYKNCVNIKKKVSSDYTHS